MQNISIQDLYLQVDSLWSSLKKQNELDTLEATLSRNWYQLDSNLTRLNLQRTLSYNPAANKADTSWRVAVNFKDEGPLLSEEKRDSLLKANLKSGTFAVSVE